MLHCLLLPARRWATKPKSWLDPTIIPSNYGGCRMVIHVKYSQNIGVNHQHHQQQQRLSFHTSYNLSCYGPLLESCWASSTVRNASISIYRKRKDRILHKGMHQFISWQHMKKKMHRLQYASKVENCWIVAQHAIFWSNMDIAPCKWKFSAPITWGGAENTSSTTTEALSSSTVQTQEIVGIQLIICQDSLNQW
jgi:hypothetical protein